MRGIFFSPDPYSYREQIRRDVRSAATEFEALLLKEILKNAYRSLLRGKSFHQRIYYDMFLENVSRKLAEAGGVGIARFVIENFRGEEVRIENRANGGYRHSSEQPDRVSPEEVRRQVSEEDIHREGA
ncbi:MAG TPA: hypothetical protein ENJ61_07265 [Aquifex aeolicus]|uniref:Flagellar protein FlgJ N-terminal domain-containing protein n=1 Tax=Aquifex aeolicus TaxID=63363 RepID=A0A7C5LB61_AQUAO|nr:hypothetical protein [Aquifex aeolicus]